MPYTPEEQERIDRITESLTDPSKPAGEGISTKFLLAVFDRVVKLRDFAAAQVIRNQQQQTFNQDIETRVANLEQDVPPEPPAP